MKPQRHWLAIALLLATSVTAFSNLSSEERQRERLRVLRTEAFKQTNLTPLDRAYLDAFTLLDQKEMCGEFFGGSTSQLALDELVIKLRNQPINDNGIGIRMSGLFTCYVNSQGRTSYRLFEKAELNIAGPFYNSKTRPEDLFVARIGSFPANTRWARVLILLHELAHLITGRNGTWLIPDDGGNPELSRQNTLTIESRCGEQIRAL
ncbi:MAG: hypothetical protein ABI923_08875 [bacterium]